MLEKYSQSSSSRTSKTSSSKNRLNFAPSAAKLYSRKLMPQHRVSEKFSLAEWMHHVDARHALNRYSFAFALSGVRDSSTCEVSSPGSLNRNQRPLFCFPSTSTYSKRRASNGDLKWTRSSADANVNIKQTRKRFCFFPFVHWYSQFIYNIIAVISTCLHPYFILSIRK